MGVLLEEYKFVTRSIQEEKHQINCLLIGIIKKLAKIIYRMDNKKTQAKFPDETQPGEFWIVS